MHRIFGRIALLATLLAALLGYSPVRAMSIDAAGCPDHGCATSEVQTILQGHILHIQKRDRPDLDARRYIQYLVVDVERVVVGEAISGTVIVGVIIVDKGRGVRLWGEDDHGRSILVLDPTYWREGRGVSIGLQGSHSCDPAVWPLDPAEPTPPGTSSEAMLEFDDEAFQTWLGQPILCTDMEHLFLVDDKGFILDSDRP